MESYMMDYGPDFLSVLAGFLAFLGNNASRTLDIFPLGIRVYPRQ